MMRGIVFGAGSQSLLIGLVGATALAGCNLLFGVDESDLPPQSTGGTAGVAGAGPKGGSAGTPTMGSAGVGGIGGVGGTGGAGGQPCREDVNCTTVGAGSLCVGERCTKAADCLPDTLVAVPADFAGAADPALAGACYHRDLGAALGALVEKTTTRVVVYAAATLTVAEPLAVPPGLTLEGRTADPSQAVTLAVTAPVADAPLVTLGQGSGLKGFALDGAGVAAGIKAETGAVRLEGPLTVANTKLALDLGGAVDATVFGRQGSAVRLSGNARGIVVGTTAKLVLSGDGDKGGVVVEGTTDGAGVLVLAGGATATVRLEGLLARNNTVSTSARGTGAVEVLKGRSVVISKGVFEGNRQALTLNGETNSGAQSFSNVRLDGNRFGLLAPGQGSVICGSKLGSETELTVGANNVFPNGNPCPTLPQLDSCGTGADVGYDSPNQLSLLCGGT